MNDALNSGYLDLVGRLEGRIDALVDGIFESFERESDWFETRPDLREMARRLSVDSGLAEMAAMRAGRLPTELSEADVAFAREAARAGSPVADIIDGYRRGHAAWWEGWWELVEEHEPEPAARRALLKRGSDFFFGYAGRMTRLVAEEHMRERDRMLSGREQRRLHLVLALLQGDADDAEGLDYPLDRHHLGTVAWGADAARTLGELAAALERPSLVVGVAGDTCWGWLGARRPLDEAGRAVLARWRPPAGCGLSLGNEAAGVEGFRRTHREALTAQGAGLRAGNPVTAFDEVALEALVAGDEQVAREFAAHELRGLDGDDARAGRLRETLRAYFSHGQNAAATAAALGVHEQTVAQRLRAVEERTGRPVAARRAELEVALRLRRHLAPLHVAADGRPR